MTPQDQITGLFLLVLILLGVAVWSVVRLNQLEADTVETCHAHPVQVQTRSVFIDGDYLKVTAETLAVCS